jgi:hypothetical protein
MFIEALGVMPDLLASPCRRYRILTSEHGYDLIS